MSTALLLLLSLQNILALEYSAKVEPLHHYTISASTSGSVIFSNEDLEGKVASSLPIIKLDNVIEQLNLTTQEKTYQNQKIIYDIKKKNYDRIKKMKSKSDAEKDAEKIALFTQASTLLSLSLNIETLKDTLSKKVITSPNMYIDKLYVKKGNYVTPGMKLLEAYDISGSRITLFVHKDEITQIHNKDIMVNHKKSDYTIDKIFKTTDSSYITAYKVELIGPAPTRFSNIVNITFE